MDNTKVGFNTSVPTPFYWQCCFPKDQMYIIQLGRPTRICKIQLSEKEGHCTLLSLTSYTPVSCCNLLLFSPHLKCLTLLYFFLVQQYISPSKITYELLIYCIVYCLHLPAEMSVPLGQSSLFTEVLPAPRIMFDV